MRKGLGEDTVEQDEDDSLTWEGRAIILKDATQLWREDTMKEWESLWQQCSKSQWTHQLLPTVKARLAVPLTPTF